MSGNFTFTLKLLDDLALSDGSATVGPHHALDYVPGSALRGALARKLYAVLSRDDAFAVFHSGAVVFDDALPIHTSTGGQGWPMPMALQFAKDTPSARRLERTVNLLRARMGPGEQPELWKRTYVTDSGNVLSVRQRRTLKTAIDAKTGLAKEKELFGHQRIAAGQQFRGRCVFKDTLDPSLRQRVLASLDRQTFELGRSKRTELGRVLIENVGAEDRPAFTSDPAGARTAVWLLADLPMADDRGMPTVLPSPDWFGLQGCRYVAAESFVRVGRRSVFNSTLGSFESEYVYLHRGSVLVFEGAPAQAAEPEGYAGGMEHSGLGRFVINHPLLDRDHPLAHAPLQKEKPAPAEEIACSGPSKAILDWLLRDPQLGLEQALQCATAVSTKLQSWYGSAGNLRGLASPLGPSPSQWGAVFEAARRSKDVKKLEERLFGGDSPVCRDRRSELPLWDAEFVDEDGIQTFSSKLRSLIAEWDRLHGHSPRNVLLTTEMLAREARVIARSLRGGS